MHICNELNKGGNVVEEFSDFDQVTMCEAVIQMYCVKNERRANYPVLRINRSLSRLDGL